MESKLEMAGVREESAAVSNAVSSIPFGGKRIRGMDLPKREDDDLGNKENTSYTEEARGQRELGVDSHSIWKKSLCSYFRRPPGGICRHADNCRYAHGEAELRQRPDNSWDPTSERAKKLLKTNNGYASAGVVDEDEDAAVNLVGLDKCLIGLPVKWASDKLKNFLDCQGISHKTAKKKKGMNVGFVSFENAEQIKNAVEVFKENPLNCKKIKVADAISGHAKNKQEIRLTLCSSSTEDGSVLPTGNGVTSGIPITEGIVPKAKAVCDVVAPLAQIPYKDQLELKKNSLLQTLKRLTRNARKACPDGVTLPEWLLKSREIGGLPCKLEGIMESPLTDGYRNKCEFSVGYSLEGKLAVGFMLGNFRDGVTSVEEPHSCPNISPISCKYAMFFQDFLLSSKLPVWNRVHNIGFWRQFTVREGRHSSQLNPNGTVGFKIAEVMLIVQVCSLSYEEDQIKSEFNWMAQDLAHEAAACLPPLPLTTIVVQDHKGVSNAAPADCPLITLKSPKFESDCGSGEAVTNEARIHDYICNLQFSISPTAFFQVNTLAAERLYSLAGDWADLTPDTILFDICCGTGTIGLTLAHRVGMVVGIEMNESAVSDANRNAKINGIKNCRFICGKAEDVMGSVLKEYLGVVSGDSRSNDALKIGHETVKMTHKECVQDDTSPSAETSTEGTVRSVEDFSMDVESRSNFNGGLRQLLVDTDNTIGFTGSCTAECVGTTQLDEGSRDTTDGQIYSSNTSNNSYSIGHFGDIPENFVLEESTARNSAVHHFKRVVAIVDPPRVGLHPTVIKALRTHPRICRLVYISCNPETLVANAIELCTPTAERPEKNKGNKGWRKMTNACLARYRVKSMPSSEAFRPVRAVGVDLFPHTPHCEMVMLLER